MSEVKQYVDRDIMDLDDKGGYYFRHVDAMTRESLHSKSDIAAELGHRDMLIDTYRELCGELIKDIDYAILAINNGFGSTQLLRDAITKAEAILGGKNGR